MDRGGKGVRRKIYKGGCGRGGPLKGRRGFGYEVRKMRRRPAIKDLLGNELLTDVVLEFLGNTQVGMVKEGVALNKGWISSSLSFLSLPLSLSPCRSFPLSLGLSLLLSPTLFFLLFLLSFGLLYGTW